MPLARTLLSVSIVLGFLTCGSGPEPTQPQSQEPAQAETTAADTAEIQATAPDTAGTRADTAQPQKQHQVQTTVPDTSEAQADTTQIQNLPKLWDFSAEWCAPCRYQDPIIQELEKEYHDQVEIKTIDVDQEKDLAQQFSIRAIPTQVFLNPEGRELSRNVGLMSKDSIIARLKTHGFID